MKIIKIIGSFLLMGMFTACLKSTDNNILNGASQGSGKSVSFINVSDGSISNQAEQSVGVTLENTPGTFTFYVQLSSTDNSYPATSVTIDTPSLSLVNAYNADNTLAFEPLPDSTFKWLNTTATVDPVTHLAAFTLQITSTKVDLGVDLDASQTGTGYALGIKIKSCSNNAVAIASNGDTKFMLIKVRNAYDAAYKVTGYFFHPTAASCRAINRSKSVSTLSIAGCYADLGDLGSSGYQFQFEVNSTTNKIGSFSVPFSLGATPGSPASGFMTGDNPGGNNPNYPGTTTAFIAKTYNNTYDPTGKIFWMHYGYGVGSSDQNGYSRQVYEKWVRN